MEDSLWSGAALESGGDGGGCGWPWNNWWPSSERERGCVCVCEIWGRFKRKMRVWKRGGREGGIRNVWRDHQKETKR